MLFRSFKAELQASHGQDATVSGLYEKAKGAYDEALGKATPEQLQAEFNKIGEALPKGSRAASMEKINWKGYRNKWVQVTGRVHFLKRKDNDQFITALILYPDAEHKLNDDLIKVVPQDSNPYAN